METLSVRKFLTHFKPLLLPYTPTKQKTSDFKMFSGGILRKQRHEMG